MKDLKFNDMAASLAADYILWTKNIDRVFTVPEFPKEHPFKYLVEIKPDGSYNKFGYCMVKPGHGYENVQAMCSDFVPKDEPSNVSWIISWVIPHQPLDDNFQISSVGESSMVHEATHYLDFVKNGKPKDTVQGSLGYYNSKHEINAYFHQGLWKLRNDLRHITTQIHFRGLIYGYWNKDFLDKLNKRNRIKFEKRCRFVFHKLNIDVAG